MRWQELSLCSFGGQLKVCLFQMCSSRQNLDLDCAVNSCNVIEMTAGKDGRDKRQQNSSNLSRTPNTLHAKSHVQLYLRKHGIVGSKRLECNLTELAIHYN